MQLARAILERQQADQRIALAAVCDIFEPRKQRARARTGARPHQHWQDLVCRNDIDAVVIATPDHWHTPMAVAAMQSGKDVYCETPMAARLDDARAFHDCAARTGRVVQIGAQEVSHGQWHDAATIIRSGQLGKPVSAHACGLTSSPSLPVHYPLAADVRAGKLDWEAFLGPAPKRPFSPERYVSWHRFSDYGAGIATGMFYPKLAAILVALGPAFPVRVSAAGGISARDGREVPDSMVMTCTYPGARTVVISSSTRRGPEPPPVIRTENAAIEFLGSTLRIKTGTQTRAVPARPRPTHLDDWLACVRTRRTCICNERLGWRTMVAVAMAGDACRQGKTLYFDPAKEEVLRTDRGDSKTISDRPTG